MRASKSVWLVCVCVWLLGAGVARAQELYDVNSRHYAITTNLERHDIKGVALHMDAVFRAYTRMFSGFTARNNKPVTLYVVDSREDYTGVLEERGIDGANSGGMFFYTFQEAGLATWRSGRPAERMYHVLQHEGFHQFAHIHIGGNFPIWVNEGLAEYFGQSLLIGERLETGLVPASRLDRVKASITEERTLPFDDFIRLDNASWSQRVAGGDARTGMMYDQAWSIAHFLVHADNGKYARAFERFIKETSRGLSIDNALQNSFGTSNLDAFETAWKEWTLELEPDPVSTGTERLDFMAQGLQYLREQGVAVTNVEEMKTELRRRSFVLRKFENGLVRELKASEDDLFAAPPAARRGRTSEVVLMVDEKGETPPTLEITGLSVRMGVAWTVGADGALTYEVVYR